MKIILTGATGMVGKGVLVECLKDERVTEILLINRAPIDVSHPKIKEVLHQDFLDFSSIENELTGYDACFHCMGVSSLGISKENYEKLTFGVSKSLANTVLKMNPNAKFTYVSGAGTDSSESGSTHWARIKGKTENYLFELGFKDAYAFRPGAIIPGKGIKTKSAWINLLLVVLKPMLGLFKNTNMVTTSENIGRTMIYSVATGSLHKILDNREINDLAKQ